MEATQRIPTLRLIGIILLLWAYGMNVHGVIGAWREAHLTPEQAASEHLREMARRPQTDMSATGHTSSQPGLTTTGVLLLGLMLAVGVGLALFPVRHGAWYGVWATLIVWIAIAGPRLLSDPRCWQVLDLNRHGCHTFMLSLAIGAAGMACCAVAQRQPPVAGA
ncbi:MAG: hypothetical protein HYX28_10125 [Candidatus Koribacter versatilis]|uniref:Uncharacterized protein n=1 Tax=Candidatus Korobacter versatilis TaxID=658062 RepID=A0A932AAF4_9BACT|nr:hypothetical protein [Candidatus Koribacter versatilis]